MRILEFKKGDLVPEWVATMNSKWMSLFFVDDATVVKEGPYCTIYSENKQHREVIEIKDNRPKWIRFFDKIKRKKYAADFSKIKIWHSEPFNYEIEGAQHGSCEEAEGKKAEG